MPDQVPESVKAARSNELLDLEKSMSLEYRRSFLGIRTEVLMEEEFRWEGNRYIVGHTKEYVKAAVPYEEGLKGRLLEGTLSKMLNEDVMILER